MAVSQPESTLSTRRPARPQGLFSIKLRKISAKLALVASVPEKRRITGPIQPISTVPTLSQGTLDLNDLTSTHTSVPLPPTVSLLPLSFAQRRRDIRERKEGFEMEKNPTPFAVRTQPLIPLDVAFTRNDIRRRHVEAEAPSSLGHDNSAALRGSMSELPTWTPRTPVLSMPTTSPDSGSPAQSTPSAYSQSRSWIDPSHRASTTGSADMSWSYDSLVAVYSNGNGMSDEEDGAEKFLADHSSSSFDEASFMRMAEDCLGW
ncbi:hypothetical protein C2E23DRAFT_188367 [Lenzites betulinus]|nr:hypothetical protein C2E23DRAFT_188367 [Lenzites betulinus]